MSALHQLLQQIDHVNHQDPNRETCPSDPGKQHAKEWLYSQRMSATLADFAPDASELLKIAAHAQHIERWKHPRSDYPQGRVGYKHWRTGLAKFHAERTNELMRAEGYSEEDCQRVADLLQKKNLKRDAEVQTLEDVICLVFLQHYLPPFAAKHNDDKVVSIIGKTWGKMSARGQQAALQLTLAEPEQALVARALAG